MAHAFSTYNGRNAERSVAGYTTISRLPFWGIYNYIMVTHVEDVILVGDHQTMQKGNETFHGWLVTDS